MISIEELRGLLAYDPETGEFTWRVRVSNAVKSGMSAGTIGKKGYVAVGIAGRYYKAHRLAWLYMTGSWPEDQIDHRDLDKANNAWGNLRLATNAQNTANVGRRRRNASGFKGVHRVKEKDGSLGGWRAQIRVNNRLIHLGVFKAAEEASVAYKEAARRHFGEFARAA